MEKAILRKTPQDTDTYNWKCPKCKSGSFTWSEKINEQWGHPPHTAFCAVCFTRHEIIKIIDCETCGGSGFNEAGTGYDSVCDDCAGQGERPE